MFSNISCTRFHWRTDLQPNFPIIFTGINCTILLETLETHKKQSYEKTTFYLVLAGEIIQKLLHLRTWTGGRSGGRRTHRVSGARPMATPARSGTRRVR
jgi:hypothetical protein